MGVAKIFDFLNNKAQKRLDEAEKKLLDIVKDLNQMNDRIVKCEIISLEGRKLYHKKLMDLYGKETKEAQKDIYNGVLSID